MDDPRIVVSERSTLSERSTRMAALAALMSWLKDWDMMFMARTRVLKRVVLTIKLGSDPSFLGFILRYNWHLQVMKELNTSVLQSPKQEPFRFQRMKK